MADTPGASFTIPAGVKLDLVNPQEFLNDIKKLVDQIQALSKSGGKPISPVTGKEMGITEIRQEIGRIYNDLAKFKPTLVEAFGAGSAQVKALEEQMRRLRSEATREMRRPSPGARPLDPIYDAGARPTKADFRQGVREAADAADTMAGVKRASDAAGKAAGSAERVAAKMGESEDPITQMVASYRKSAELSRRIAANEQKVLDERIKSEVAAAQARQAYAKKFDTDTPAGKARTTEFAAANVADERRRLQQRNMEIGLTRLAGGEKTIALNRYLEEGLARSVRIEQYKLDQVAGSAKAMAEEKRLREQQKRAVEGQVRKQTTAAEITEIGEDKAAERRMAVRREKAALKAITDTDRQREATLARERRLSEIKQREADQAALNTTAGQRLLRREAKGAAEKTVADAKARQLYLDQFDVSRKAGRERTAEVARTAVREREQALAQRSAEIGISRERGGVAREAAAKVLESTYQREISIEQTKLDLAQGSAKSMAEQKVLNDQLNREIAAEVRAQQDIKAIAQENIAKQRDRLRLRQETRRAETPEDLQQIAADKLAEQARQRDIAGRVRAGTDVDALAAEQADIRRQRIAKERAALAQVTSEDRAAEAQLAAERRLEKAQQGLANQAVMRTEVGQRVMAAEQQLAAETQELKARRAQLAATDQKLLVATAAEANAREEQAARVSLLRGGARVEDVMDLSREQLLARAAVMKRTQADLHRAEVIRQTTQEDIEAAAQKKLAEAKLRVAMEKREREIFREASRTGGGDWFQNLQSRLSARPRLPEENLKLGQFLGDKFQRTVGYAASGAALGMGVAAISEMFKDAMELETTFVRLRGQMEGIGRSDAFPRVRDQIREIAAETGQASNKVGALYSRMLGLSRDPAIAARDALDASKLMTVTGLDEKVVEESIVPVRQAFGVTSEEIGNEVVAMGEKFGIAEADLTQFLGKTAVTAKNAGLSMHELISIGANMANSLGKPISSSAEAINKSFSLIEKNAIKIFDVLRSNPATAGYIDELSKAIGQGKSGEALIKLLEASTKFNPQQRQDMLSNVVSRRESEEFNALLSNARQTLDDISAGGGDASGRLNERFEDLKDTVQLTFQQIRASFESLGDLLFKSGVSDWLKDLASLLGIVVGLVNMLAGVLASLNEIPILGGAVSTFGRMAAITFTLIKLSSLFGKSIDKLSASTKEQTVSETANASAKGRTTTVNEGLAVSEQGVTTAREGATVATRTQTRTTGAAGGVPYTWTRGRGYTAAPAGTEVAAEAAPGRFRAYRENTFERVAQTQAIRSSTRAELGAARAARDATRAAEEAARTAARQPLGQRLSNWMLTPWGDPSGRIRQGPSLAQRAGSRIRDFRDDRATLYQARRAQYGEVFAQQAGAGTLQQAGFLTRARAGGLVFKSAAADAQIAATGQAALGASPIAVGAVIAAGVLAVKSAYDENKQKTVDAAAQLRARMSEATAQQLREMGELNGDFWTDVAGALWGTETMGREIEQHRRGVIRLEETGAERRALGAATKTVKSGLEAAGEQVAARQVSFDKQIAERLGPEKRANLIRKLLETREGTAKLNELGLARHTLGLNIPGPRGGEGNNYAIAADNVDKFAELVTWARSDAAKEMEGASDFVKGTFDTLQGMGATDLLGSTSDLKTAADAIAAQQGGQTLDQYLAADAKRSGLDIKTFEELQKLFQAGQLTEAEYITQLKARLPQIQRLAQQNQGNDLGRQLNDLQIQINDAIKNVTNASIDNYDNLVTQFKARGSLTPKAVTAKGSLTRVLKEDRQKQFEELPNLMNQEMEATEEAWDSIYDPQARVDAMNAGAKFSPDVRRIFLDKQLDRADKAEAAIKKVAAATGQDWKKLRDQLSQQAAQEGKTLGQVAEEYIDKQISYYGEQKKHGNIEQAASAAKSFNELTAARSDFIGALSEVPDIPTDEADPNKKKVNQIKSDAVVRKLNRERQSIGIMGDSVAMAHLNAQEAWADYNDLMAQKDIPGAGITWEKTEKARIEAMKADRSAADAEFNYAMLVANRKVIEARGDPVKETQAQLDNARKALGYAQRQGNKDDAERARQDIMRLQQQAEENTLNIIRSAMAVQQARDAEDPLQLAKDQLKAAELELANARGDADRGQKEAAVIAAQKNVNNAMSAGITADVQLAIRLANLRGDSVEATRRQAEEAQRLLDEALAKGITDPTVLDPLKGNLAEALKNKYLAPIQEEISDLDFFYGMEQISLGDYIAGLEARLSQMTYDSDEYRDLALKIHNLKKGAQADLGWNLPGNLTLPTLYEARRASQTVFNPNMAGAAYQDNRNIQVNIAVNGAQDPVTVATQVSAALNESLRGGPTYTAGLPVSAGM